MRAKRQVKLVGTSWTCLTREFLDHPLTVRFILQDTLRPFWSFGGIRRARIYWL